MTGGGEQVQLERLDAYKNKIVALSPKVALLSNLKELNLFNNQV